MPHTCTRQATHAAHYDFNAMPVGLKQTPRIENIFARIGHNAKASIDRVGGTACLHRSYNHFVANIASKCCPFGGRV